MSQCKAQCASQNGATPCDSVCKIAAMFGPITLNFFPTLRKMELLDRTTLDRDFPIAASFSATAGTLCYIMLWNI